jgi:hypothetical protein
MRVAKERYQRLSGQQEACVCSWIRHMKETFGIRPTYQQITAFAGTILAVGDNLAPGGNYRGLGKNWISSFFYRNPEIKAFLQSTNIPPRLLHENETAFNWNKMLYFQFALFQLAKRDPSWTSVSKFDFPGATQTYHTLKCAIWHFKAHDMTNGGRFVRKAFVTLEEEVSKGDLNVVQDICLNLLGMLNRNNQHAIGIAMLRHCSDWVQIRPPQQLHYNIFLALSEIMGQGGAQSDYYLRQLTGIYAVELNRVGASPDRRATQAQRRHQLIVRDSRTTATAEEINATISSSEHLLKLATSELGSTHDRTLRIENDTLRLQSYIGTFQDSYIRRVDDAMSKLAQLYPPGHGRDTFELWLDSHQSAFLRFLERKYDYYKHVKENNEAINIAQSILRRCGYRTERWICFSLQFEHWLKGLGQISTYECCRQERLNSMYYRQLEEEFRGEETMIHCENASQHAHNHGPNYGPEGYQTIQSENMSTIQIDSE